MLVNYHLTYCIFTEASCEVLRMCESFGSHSSNSSNFCDPESIIEFYCFIKDKEVKSVFRE